MLMFYLLAGFIGTAILLSIWFIFSPADVQYRIIRAIRRLRWFASKEDKFSAECESLLSKGKRPKN